MRTSDVSLRSLAKGEEGTLLGILESAYGHFHNETEVKALLGSRRFDPGGCFLADRSGSPVGSVAVTTLARNNWFVIRYLAVRRGEEKNEIAQTLLAKALDYARFRRSEFVRATTPAIEPYVEIYKKSGFAPVRRDFRIGWDIRRMTRGKNTALKVEQVSEERSREAASVFVKALSPFWDWRTEENGGSEAVANSFNEGLRRGEKWFLCSSNGKAVGMTGMIIDYYGPGEGRFRGAYVLPEHRGRGLGLSVMTEGLNTAKKLGQNRLVVYTFSYLDCLAPGALLYLRSGGKIEAEYTQLTTSPRSSTVLEDAD